MSNFHLTYQFLWWSRPRAAPRPPPEGLQRHWIETPQGRLEVLSAMPSGKPRGPPIVFMHGGMGGAWVWAEYMGFLAARGIACYAVSARGHGNSWHPSYLQMVFCTTRRMLADDLVAGVRWVQDRQESEVVLVGHSSGGGLVQAVLSEGDVSAKGLALLGAVPGFGSMSVYANWARADPWFSVRMLLQGWHPNSPLSHPELVRRIFFAGDVAERALVDFMGRLNRYESFLWPFSMMRPFADQAKVLGQIHNDGVRKVLVLTGSEDKLMTPPIMEKLGAFYRDAAAAAATEPGQDGRRGSDAVDEVVEVSFVEGAGHHLQNDIDWEVGAKKLLDFYEQI